MALAARRLGSTAKEKTVAGMIIPEEYETNPYMNLLVKATATDKRRLIIGLPTTGLVRIEFVVARYSQTIPCNWSCAENLQPIQWTPLGYDVKDARNLIVQAAVERDFEFLLFIDHDVILPPDCFLKMNEYIRDGTIPIVAGLYVTKSQPSEPLVYRGRGNSYYRDWKIGDKVWVDGTGMGCTLLSVKLLREMWKDAPEYLTANGEKAHKVFDTPQFTWIDPEIPTAASYSGTEDLAFFDRVREGGYLAKAGFKKIAKKRYFVLMDSSIFCRHIDQNGVQYPLELRW
jgi:hypothetical protein